MRVGIVTAMDMLRWVKGWWLFDNLSTSHHIPKERGEDAVVVYRKTL
jgi:hypothetical protein